MRQSPVRLPPPAAGQTSTCERSISSSPKELQVHLPREDCSRCPVLLEDSDCASMCPAPHGKHRPIPSCHGGAGEPASPRASPSAGPWLRRDLGMQRFPSKNPGGLRVV